MSPPLQGISMTQWCHHSRESTMQLSGLFQATGYVLSSLNQPGLFDSREKVVPKPLPARAWGGVRIVVLHGIPAQNLQSFCGAWFPSSMTATAMCQSAVTQLCNAKRGFDTIELT